MRNNLGQLVRGAEDGVVMTGLLYEFAQDNLTAHAGGGQTNALQLVAQTNRITTVATTGDSVALPPSFPGLEVVVVNSGANPMQVFGSGTDTINGIATGTGISQMANSMVIYACATAGQWYCMEPGNGFAGQFPTVSTTDNLTAHAGGGQQAASPVFTVINRFTTVATANDSATLPVSAPGMQVYIFNAAGANSMNVFPNTGGQINAAGANAAFAVAAGKNAVFIATSATQWHAILSA